MSGPTEYIRGLGARGSERGVPGRGGPLHPGGVVGDGRYRLLAQFGVDNRAAAHFWRARDGQLNRDVALTILVGDAADSQSAIGAGRTLERAMHAATFNHSGVATVLDVLSLGSGIVPSEGILGMVVAEWTHGTDLLDVTSDGPVPPATASRLLEPLAAAVESAHHVGLVLGVDHPQRVRVTPDGALRLAFPGPLPMATLRDDVKGLGALLYLLLTGRWALPDGPEALPSAPFAPDGSIVAPNALQSNVPSDLASIAVRSLEDTAVGGIRTSAAIIQVLDRVVEDEAITTALPTVEGEGEGAKRNPEEGVWITKRPVQDRQHKRRLALWVTILAVATVAVVVWVITSVIGFFGGSPSGPAGPTVAANPPAAGTPVGSPSAPPTSAAALGAPLTPSKVSEFDIKGGSDYPSQAKRVIDGNPATAWKTDLYHEQLPVLKPGIGLVATFDQPVSLAEIAIDSPSAGTVVEIRTSPTSHPTDINSTQLIGTATLINGHTVIQLNRGQPGRYVLVWITQLASRSTGSGYQSSIGEITYIPAD